MVAGLLASPATSLYRDSQSGNHGSLSALTVVDAARAGPHVGTGLPLPESWSHDLRRCLLCASVSSSVQLCQPCYAPQRVSERILRASLYQQLGNYVS